MSRDGRSMGGRSYGGSMRHGLPGNFGAGGYGGSDYSDSESDSTDDGSDYTEGPPGYEGPPPGYEPPPGYGGPPGRGGPPGYGRQGGGAGPPGYGRGSETPERDRLSSPWMDSEAAHVRRMREEREAHIAEYIALTTQPSKEQPRHEARAPESGRQGNNGHAPAQDYDFPPRPEGWGVDDGRWRPDQLEMMANISRRLGARNQPGWGPPVDNAPAPAPVQAGFPARPEGWGVDDGRWRPDQLEMMANISRRMRARGQPGW